MLSDQDRVFWYFGLSSVIVEVFVGVDDQGDGGQSFDGKEKNISNKEGNPGREKREEGFDRRGWVDG